MERIEDKAKTVDALVRRFKAEQTRPDGCVTLEDKTELRERFRELDGELTDLLATAYGIRSDEVKPWRATHKPFHWFSEFHQIMNAGGFDAIIGNPPYLEYKKVTDEYTLPAGYDQFLGNLYAACCFRATQLASSGGYLSFIVPVSLPSTDRMACLRSELLKHRSVYSVSFSTRPQKLFEGAEQRLTIYIQVPDAKPTLHSGAYLKWATEERANLFSRVRFIATNPVVSRKSVWPKVGSTPEHNILRRCHSMPNSIGSLCVGTGSYLYYKNTGLRYFNTTTLRPPRCWINGQATSSSRETSIGIKNEWLGAVHCVLISTTFFLVYQAMSNCRDLNPSDIITFGIPKTLTDDGRFVELSHRVEEDCVAKGKILTMNHKLTGKVELESLSPAKSKPLIDQIDTILASHYGFSEEELDFIINYDIKYRLGTDSEADD